MPPIRLMLADDHEIVRAGVRMLLQPHPDIEIVAINDLTDIKNLVYLLKYDTPYRDIWADNVKINYLTRRGLPSMSVRKNSETSLPLSRPDIRHIRLENQLFLVNRNSI